MKKIIYLLFAFVITGCSNVNYNQLTGNIDVTVKAELDATIGAQIDQIA